MPLPPGEEEEKTTEENSEPKLQFSYVECLIFAFHQLAKKVDMNSTFDTDHRALFHCVVISSELLITSREFKP